MHTFYINVLNIQCSSSGRLLHAVLLCT